MYSRFAPSPCPYKLSAALSPCFPLRGKWRASASR
nr:MAG TPA: hypothetical protein [Caudoviricetes sp.]